MRSRAWRVGISGRLWIFREYGDYREKGRRVGSTGAASTGQTGAFLHALTFCYHIRIRREVDFGYAHPGFDGGFEGGAVVRQRSGRAVADAHGRRHAQERFPLYHRHGGWGSDRLPLQRAFWGAHGGE